MHCVTLSVLEQLGPAACEKVSQEWPTPYPLAIVKASTVSFTIVGFLIGVLAAAGVGVRVIEELRTSDDATSLPAENVATTRPEDRFFIDPTETMIASTALVPTSTSQEATVFTVEYEIVPLAPREGAQGSLEPTLFPKEWDMSAAGRTIKGLMGDPNGRRVAFDLPDGLGAGDITSVQIVDPLIAYPLDVRFELSAGTPAARINDRVRVELIEIRDTTVEIRFEAEDPADLAFSVEMTEPGWGEVVRSGSTVTIERQEGDPSDLLSLRAVGLQWVELVGSFPVALGGFE